MYSKNWEFFSVWFDVTAIISCYNLNDLKHLYFIEMHHIDLDDIRLFNS